MQWKVSNFGEVKKITWEFSKKLVGITHRMLQAVMNETWKQPTKQPTKAFNSDEDDMSQIAVEQSTN